MDTAPTTEKKTKMLPCNPPCAVVLNIDNHRSVTPGTDKDTKPVFPLPKRNRVTFDASGIHYRSRNPLTCFSTATGGEAREETKCHQDEQVHRDD
jgi:hypothetical protein